MCIRAAHFIAVFVLVFLCKPKPVADQRLVQCFPSNLKKNVHVRMLSHISLHIIHVDSVS